MGEERGQQEPQLFRPPESRKVTLPGFPRSASPGVPEVRAKGAQKGGLLARVQSLSPQKLALLSAGLGLLILTPLVEIMTRPADDGRLTRGFDQKLSAFDENGSPYEEGVLGMAAGGLPGQDNRVITPGDFADPTTLIKSDQPEAPELREAAGPAAPPAKPATDWKEVLSKARRANESASAPPPRKGVVLKAVDKLKSMLSGLRTGSTGGSGAGFQVARLEAPRSDGLTGTQRVASSLTRLEKARDYRGTSSASGASGGGSVRRGIFDGGAGGGTDTNAGFLRGKVTNDSGVASAQARSGGGGLDADGPGKDPSGSSSKDNRAFEAKESLGELAKKLNMQKSIEHKWKKREWAEIGSKQKAMEIKGQLANTALQGAFQLAGAALQGGGKGEQGGGSGAGSGGGAGAGERGSNPAGNPSGPGDGSLIDQLRAMRVANPESHPATTAYRDAEAKVAAAQTTSKAAAEAEGGFKEAAGKEQESKAKKTAAEERFNKASTDENLKKPTLADGSANPNYKPAKEELAAAEKEKTATALQHQKDLEAAKKAEDAYHKAIGEHNEAQKAAKQGRTDFRNTIDALPALDQPQQTLKKIGYGLGNSFKIPPAIEPPKRVYQ